MYELVFIFFMTPLVPTADVELIQYEYVFDYKFKTKSGCMISTWPAFRSEEIQEYYLDLGVVNGVNRECRFTPSWAGRRHRNVGRE